MYPRSGKRVFRLLLPCFFLAVPLSAQMSPPEVQEMVVRTRDYEFDVPEVVRSGPTHLRLINEGPDFHHVWLVRLLEGKTVKDLTAHLAQGHGPMPSWAVDEGGPNTPGRPGEEASVYLDLKPGSYAMLCVIPAAADGRLHVEHGMVASFTVENAGENPAPLPEADLTMVLDDYSFGLSKVITPGRHTIRVENRAAQVHEVVVVRLAEEKTAQDYLQWLGTREGAEPGKMMGGVTGLAQGKFNLMAMEFTEGRYAFLCFVPDVGDGQPHFMHGMVQEFSVEGEGMGAPVPRDGG